MTTGALADRRRDVRVIGILGVVHLFSHFYQLSLAPLFPLISRDLDISNLELGFFVSLFYIASGTLQTPAGFLVDRVGARPVLLGGLGLLSLAVAGYSLAPSYGVMAVLLVLAGAGNSVFHPADYSMINQSVHSRLVGRAYSIHGVGGHAGFALAPVVIAPLALWLGWRGALAAAGLTGVALVLLLLMGGGKALQGSREQAERPARDGRQSKENPIAVLLKPSILAFFVFFTLFAMATIGLQNFTAAALVMERGVSLLSASAALAGFLVAAPIGILVGGVIADRAHRHHDLIATGGFVGAGLFLLAIPVFTLDGNFLLGALALAGFLFGTTLPNRDLIIRRATPPGASGRVFGFIYCGLDIGSAVTPTLYGWFLDLGNPRWIFIGSGLLLLAAALLVVVTARLMAAAGDDHRRETAA